MDKKLIALMLIFFLAFGLFATIAFFNKPLTQLTQAKQETLPSSDSSLIFAWPLTAKAYAKTNVQINIFVRNANNIPIAGKTVSVNSTLGIVTAVQSTTDKSGRATFNLTSNSAGLAQVTATVDNQVQLKQKVTINFQ